MTTFQILDMTCGHCVGAITRAVQALDAQAQLAFDLASHRVTVAHSAVTPAALAAAITEAGYTPTELVAQPAPAAAAQTQRRAGGCGCGSGGCHA